MLAWQSLANLKSANEADFKMAQNYFNYQFKRIHEQVFFQITFAWH